MPIKNYFQNKPRQAVVAIGAIFLGAIFAVTQVQASIDEQQISAVDNPHWIPNELNPKLHRAEERMLSVARVVKVEIHEVGEKMFEEVETIHSLAFKNVKNIFNPVYDYTTGTSN